MKCWELSKLISHAWEKDLSLQKKKRNGEHLREKGGEFGTTTGRPRRCGWFDIPLHEKPLTSMDILPWLSQA